MLLVADDRKEASLTPFFEPIGQWGRFGIERLAMDMHQRYFTAMRNALADADSKILFDKFHAAPHLWNAVNDVLIEKHRALRAKETLGWQDEACVAAQHRFDVELYTQDAVGAQGQPSEGGMQLGAAGMDALVILGDQELPRTVHGLSLGGQGALRGCDERGHKQHDECMLRVAQRPLPVDQGQGMRV